MQEICPKRSGHRVVLSEQLGAYGMVFTFLDNYLRMGSIPEIKDDAERKLFIQESDTPM